jgi:hypothetical protein
MSGRRRRRGVRWLAAPVTCALVVAAGPAAVVPASAAPVVKPNPSVSASSKPKPPRGKPGSPTPTPSPTATATPTRSASPRPAVTSGTTTAATPTTSSPVPEASPTRRGSRQGAVAGSGTSTATTTATPTATPAPPASPAPAPAPAALAPDLRSAPAVARRIARVATNDPQLPLGILVLVGLFLLVQGRIDRRDPTLLRAWADYPEELDFDPPATGTPAPGAP